MKHSKKVVVAVTLALLLLPLQTWAVNTNYALENNMSKGAEWVNWMPSSFVLDKTVGAVAEQIAAMAETREQIPQITHDWVCENIYYDNTDLETETYSTLAASDVLRERRGVCEGIANLVQALLIANDIPCIKVWGVAIDENGSWEDAAVSTDRINHTWNEYYMNGRWAPIDCTMDMGNFYYNNAFWDGAWKSDYFAPELDFFTETHLILQRGFDYPSNIPDRWAISEITEAVNVGIIPVGFLLDYRASISSHDFMALIDVENGSYEPIKRSQAALAISERLLQLNGLDAPFDDISTCSQSEQAAIRTLYDLRIMIGDGEHFMPNNYLTKQEAIIVVNRIQRLGR